MLSGIFRLCGIISQNCLQCDQQNVDWGGREVSLSGVVRYRWESVQTARLCRNSIANWLVLATHVHLGQDLDSSNMTLTNQRSILWNAVAGLSMVAALGSVAVADSLAETAASQASDSGNSSPQQLTNSLLQDEIGDLPEDNTAFFTASRRVQLQLDLLAAGGVGDLDSVLVNVIRPDGRKTQLTPDADGKVTIRDLKPGPHAVVASGDRVHGTTLYYLDEKAGAGGNDFADLLDNDLGPPDSVDDDMSTKTLTMLQIDPEKLGPTLDRVRPFARSEKLGPMDINIGDSFSYSVTLGPDGTLSGRVISLVDIPVGGTQIEILFAGQTVGTTVASPDGSFRIRGLRSGVHGLIASGRAGFAAFAFQARKSAELAETRIPFQQTFVSVLQGDEQLPVVLVPPQQLEGVIEVLEQRYPALRRDTDALGADVAGDGFGSTPFGPPAAGFGGGGFPAGPGGGGFSSGGGGSFFGGGGGGLGGLGGLGVLAAALANSNDDNNGGVFVPPILPPGVASPSTPAAQ